MTNIYVEHGGIGLKIKIVASLIQSYNRSYPYWPLWPWNTYSLQLSIFLFVIMVLRHLWKDQKAIRTCLKAQSIRNKVGKLFHGSFQLNWFIFDLKSLHLIFEKCLQFNLCTFTFLLPASSCWTSSTGLFSATTTSGDRRSTQNLQNASSSQ